LTDRRLGSAHMIGRSIESAKLLRRDQRAEDVHVEV
jgi:hypothetical protein